MNKFIVTVISAIIASGCATQIQVCEDVVVKAEQVQQCLNLQRQIVNAKGKPIVRTELERRYQLDCVEVRYYRDDQKSDNCQVADEREKVLLEAKKLTKTEQGKK